MEKTTTYRMDELINQVDSFLKNYHEGDELKLLISSTEKTFLERYVRKHPDGGSAFYFQHGVIKPGRLEHDYRLRKLQR